MVMMGLHLMGELPFKEVSQKNNYLDNILNKISMAATCITLI